jgi:ribosomal protein S18 acetylase RimI-like enzyme
MIRRAGIADTVEIRALMESVAGFWDETWRPDVLGRALTSPDTIALVHQDGDAIDGFLCAHDLGFRAYLSELVVSPQARRRGIGSRLLSEVERHMADRGCSLIVGDVWRDAEGFYRAQGWTPPSVVLLRKRLSRSAAQPTAQGSTG